MTRKCYDSVTVGDLPVGADLYLGYINGRWPNADAIAARFPGKTVVRCSVFAHNADSSWTLGDVLDVENGDATPAQAPGWVDQRRQAGHKGPLVYCSEAAWYSVRQAFHDQHVDEPGYWIAGYPGSAGAGNLYPGSVAHQWIDHGPYDESVVIDYLIGIDPVPTPPSTEDPNVTSQIYGGSVHVFGEIGGVAYHWWQSESGGQSGTDWSWHVEPLPVK